MEWWIWFTWWSLFNFWHSHQKTWKHSHETLAAHPPIQIYPNKIKNRIIFKLKTGYELELLSPETMKLLGSTKEDADKDKDGEDIWYN